MTKFEDVQKMVEQQKQVLEDIKVLEQLANLIQLKIEKTEPQTASILKLLVESVRRCYLLESRRNILTGGEALSFEDIVKAAKTSSAEKKDVEP